MGIIIPEIQQQVANICSKKIRKAKAQNKLGLAVRLKATTTSKGFLATSVVKGKKKWDRPADRTGWQNNNSDGKREDFLNSFFALVFSPRENCSNGFKNIITG